MANNKRASTEVRRVAPNANWVNNALKSLGLSALNVAEEIMPTTYTTMHDSMGEANKYIQEMRKGKSSQQRISDTLKNNAIIKGADEIIKNGIKDLKSGNIYNKTRDNMTKNMMGDMGLDDLEDAFNDFDDIDFGDDIFTDEDDSTADSNTNVVVQNDNRVNVSPDSYSQAAALEPVTNAVTQAAVVQAQATQASNTVLVEMASRNLFQNKQLGTDVINKLSSIESHLSAMVQYNNESMSKYIEASIAYYDKALPKQKESEYQSANNDNALFGEKGELNIKNYLSGMKDSFMKSVGDTDLGSIISFLPMMKDMLADNPIGLILNASMKGMIPGLAKKSLTDLDNAFKSFTPALLEKFSDYTYQGDNDMVGTVMETLIRTLGRKEKNKTGIDVGAVTKENVAWDSISRHTLVEIIPKYLRESTAYLKAITATVTGDDDTSAILDSADIFNFKNGNYTTRKKLQRDYFEEIEDSAVDSFDRSSFSKALSTAGGVLDRDDRSSYDDLVKQFKFKLVQGNKRIDRENNPESIRALIDGLTGDDKYKELLMSAIMNMSNSDFMSGDAARRAGVRSYAQKLEEIEKNPADYRLYDIYDSASLNNKNVKNDVYKFQQQRANRNFVTDAPEPVNEVSVSINRLPGSLGNGPVAILGDIREILLRGINVRVDRASSKLYGRNIPDYIEHLEQPNFVGPVPQRTNNNQDTNSYTTNEPTESHTEDVDKAEVVRGQYDEEVINAFESEEWYENYKASNGSDSILGDIAPASVREKRTELGEKAQRQSEKAKNMMYNIIYGGADQAVNAMLTNLSEKAIDAGTKLFDSFVKPVVGYVFEDDEENGRVSIATRVENTISDAGKGIQYYLFGKGYTKSDGTEVAGMNADQIKEESFAGRMKTMFGTTVSSINEYLFGKEDTEEDSNKPKLSLTQKMTNIAVDSMMDWRDVVFGEESERTPEARTEAIEKTKKFAMKAIPNTLVSTAAITGIGALSGGSLLGAALGGPLGSIIGLGIGIASSSEDFKEKVFGKENENGEYIEGLISKKTQDFFKENKSNIIGGAAVGLTKNLILGSSGGILGTLVGGPIAGALLGAGFGMIKKSESFQNLLYGKEEIDENGVKKRVGGILTKMHGPSKDAMIKAARMGATGAIGGGLIGTMLGGPIMGSLIGLSTGILASGDKFQDLLFGPKDSDGKRDPNKGILSRFTNFAKISIFKPLENAFSNSAAMIKHHLKYSITEPIKIAFSPLAAKIKSKINDLNDLGNTIKSSIKNGIKGFFSGIWRKIVNSKLGQGIGKILGGAVKLPTKILGGAAETFRRAMYTIGATNQVAGVIGTGISNTIGGKGLLNIDRFKENLKGTSIGHGGVTALLKSGVQNIAHAGKTLVNWKGDGEEKGTYDKALEDAGLLDSHVFAGIKKNERERKADYESIKRQARYNSAVQQYQNAVMASTGYSLPMNKYGLIDNDALNASISERAKKEMEEYNSKARSFFGKKNQAYFEDKIRKDFDKRTKSARKNLGIDSTDIADINEAILNHVDRDSGKSIRDLMEADKPKTEEQLREEQNAVAEEKFRTEVIDTFNSVGSDVTTIREEIIKIEAARRAQVNGTSIARAEEQTRNDVDQAQQVFDKTSGNNEAKKKAANARLKTAANSHKNENREPVDNPILGDFSGLDTEMGAEGFADGTDNAKSGVRVVGERGPELVRFRGGESVTAANRIQSALGRAFRSDSDLLKLDNKRMSIEERMLSVLISLRSIITGQSPDKQFTLSTLNSLLKSGVNGVAEFVKHPIKTTGNISRKVAGVAKGAVGKIGSVVGSMTSSMSSLFGSSPSEEPETDDEYYDSSRTEKSDTHEELQMAQLEASGISSEEADKIRDQMVTEQREADAEASYKDVSSKSYQNHEKTKRQEDAQLATINTSEKMEELTTIQKDHSAVWSNIFGPKGKVAALLLIAAPLLITILKKLKNFSLENLLSSLFGGLGSTLSSLFGNVGTLLKNIISAIPSALSTGLSTGVSTYETQTENGATDGNGNVVSASENAINQAGNILSSTGDAISDAASLNIADAALDLHTAAHGDTVGNNEITTTTESVNKLEAKTIIKGTSKGYKAVKAVGSSVDNAVQATLSGNSTLGQRITTSVVVASDQAAQKGVQYFESLFTKLVNKFAETSVGKKLEQSVFKDIVDTVMTKLSSMGDTFYEKFGKTMFEAVSEGASKAATAVATLGASEVTWVVLGALNGTTGAAKLFGVSKANVDTVMTLISTTWGAIAGTDVGSILDLAFALAAEFGFDILQTAASMLYVAIMGATGEDADAASEKLLNAQDTWRGMYEDYKENEIATQAETYNKIHGTNYTADEYEEAATNNTSVDGPKLSYMSYEEYNSEENATFAGYTFNNVTSGIVNAVSDDFTADYTNEAGEHFTYVRNNSGTFDVYSDDGSKVGVQAALPDGAMMNTTQQSKYQTSEVLDSEYGNTSYFSEDGSEYVIFNGNSFDVYDAKTNKQTSSKYSIDKFNTLIETGTYSIGDNEYLEANQGWYDRYGAGKLWKHKASGEYYALYIEDYKNSNMKTWLHWDKDGNFVGTINDDGFSQNIQDAIDGGYMERANEGTYDYNDSDDVSSEISKGIGDSVSFSLSSYLSLMDSAKISDTDESNVLGTRQTVSYYDDGESEDAALSKLSTSDNKKTYTKYANKIWYDQTGAYYQVDTQLYNTSGNLSFLKYSSTGDFIKSISSSSSEFSNILNGIEDGSITNKNPLDSETVKKSKDAVSAISEMTDEQINDYVEQCVTAINDAELDEGYSEGYNGVMMDNMDKTVAWFIPATGAYYIRTSKGFIAYNAQGCMIGEITSATDVATIFMQIETGMLERGTALVNNTKQQTTSGGSTIASALSVTTPSTSTTVVSTSTQSSSGSVSTSSKKSTSDNAYVSQLESKLKLTTTSDSDKASTAKSLYTSTNKIYEYKNKAGDVMVYDPQQKKCVKKSESEYVQNLEEYGDGDATLDTSITGGSGGFGPSESDTTTINTIDDSSNSKSSDTNDDANITIKTTSDNSDTKNNFTYYSQNDNRWGNEPYLQTEGKVAEGDDETISSRGCGPAALAMVAKGLTGDNTTPVDVANASEKAGYSDETGTNWNFMNTIPSQFGLTATSMYNPSVSFIDQSLRSGNPVIISGQGDSTTTPYTESGHYSVIVGKEKGKYLVNDPRGANYSHAYSTDEVLNGSQIASWSMGKSNMSRSQSMSDRFKEVLDKRMTNTADGNDGDTLTEAYSGGGRGAYDTQLSKYAPVAQEVWKSCGILPSVTLGQCITETGFGKSGHGVSYNNYLGHGWSFGGNTPYCTSYYTHSSGSSNPSKWCKYNSVEDCIRNHGYVLSGQSGNTRYKAAVGETNYKKAINAIADGGYCSGNYASQVIKYIEQYNLTQYDTGSFNGTVASPGSSSSGSSGNSNAINSPYRGTFTMSQQFKGSLYPEQVSGNHDGYDLYGNTSKTLHSTVPGTVVHAGWESDSDHSKGFGQYVKIQKNGNEDEYYFFGHMSEIYVKVGDVVEYGTELGVEGTTGKSTGNHVHYCIRNGNGKALNVTTMSNIPNELGQYTDNGEYGSGSGSSSSSTDDTTTTVVKEQTVFEKLITGLSNLAGRVVNGLATGVWDDDWSTILNNSSTVTTVGDSSSSGTASLNGDYIGKYVKQFESGNSGSSTVSSGANDPNGGPSFGSYQFPSYWNSTAKAGTSLYDFWNKYYASTNSDVTPGNNQAFIARWKQLAEADPDGFFANEYQYCYDNYYKAAKNKSSVVGTVDPDKHRSTQESFWSTVIQFGTGTDCWAKGHSGMTDSTDETTMINTFQEYKANRQPGCATRHRTSEKNVLLGLVGQSPLGGAGGGFGMIPDNMLDTPRAVAYNNAKKLPSVKEYFDKIGITGETKVGRDDMGYHPTEGGGMGDGMTESSTINGYPYYSQNDARWADSSYEQTAGIPINSDNETMSNRGCGPTALAMAAEGLTGEKVSPLEAASLAEKYGYSDESGTNWDYMSDAPEYFGIKSEGVRNPSDDFIDMSLLAGRPVILSGYSNNTNTPYTSAGHYVVAVGKKDGKYLVNDPRGSKYSKAYSADDLITDASAGWSMSNSDATIKKKPITTQTNTYKSKQGGNGYSTADFVAACSMACSELGRNDWAYSQSAARTYNMNGKEIVSRSDCSGMVSAALIYLGILSSPITSGTFTQQSTKDKICSALPMECKSTSSLSDSDWDNLPGGCIVAVNGHVEVLMGWNSSGGSIVYSGGSNPSKVGFRTAYNWKEGDTTVAPYSSNWGGSSYRNYFSVIYVPTDGGAQYNGSSVTAGSGTSSSSSSSALSALSTAFDTISTGTSTLVGRVWQGLATGIWDDDWSTLFGTTTTTTSDGTTVSDSSSDDTSSTVSDEDATVSGTSSTASSSSGSTASSLKSAKNDPVTNNLASKGIYDSETQSKLTQAQKILDSKVASDAAKKIAADTVEEITGTRPEYYDSNGNLVKATSSSSKTSVPSGALSGVPSDAYKYVLGGNGDYRYNDVSINEPINANRDLNYLSLNNSKSNRFNVQQMLSEGSPIGGRSGDDSTEAINKLSNTLTNSLSGNKSNSDKLLTVIQQIASLLEEVVTNTDEQVDKLEELKQTSGSSSTNNVISSRVTSAGSSTNQTTNRSEVIARALARA